MEYTCIFCGIKVHRYTFNQWCSVGCEVYDRMTHDDWLRWLIGNELFRNKLNRSNEEMEEMSDVCKLCGEKLGHDDDSNDTCRWCIAGWKEDDSDALLTQEQGNDN